ncbi:MAG: hypothetical protein ACI90V_006267 [Bacillariaceae sp.]|jgi:hypothetical protein
MMFDVLTNRVINWHMIDDRCSASVMFYAVPMLFPYRSSFRWFCDHVVTISSLLQNTLVDDGIFNLCR